MTPETLAALLDLTQVKRGLFLIRLAEVDPGLPFHVDLLHSLAACPPDASDGDLVTAIRFVAGQAKAAAATEHVTARNAYRQLRRVEGRIIREERKVSVAASERMVEEESEAFWALKMRADLAEVASDHLRDLLYALQATLDNYRTTRADERAADAWAARSGV